MLLQRPQGHTHQLIEGLAHRRSRRQRVQIVKGSLLQQLSGALQVELLDKAGVVGLRHQEAHVEVVALLPLQGQMRRKHGHHEQGIHAHKRSLRQSIHGQRNVALQDCAELRNVTTVRGGDSCRCVVSNLVLLSRISNR